MSERPPAFVAGAVGCLLRHGPGAVRSGVLRRGAALPAGRRALAASRRHQPSFYHQALGHQGPAPPGSGSPGRTVPSRRPAARRAGSAGLLLPGPPACQPGRHHHRPARCPRPGHALRAARRLARGERLSPVAPAGAGRTHAGLAAAFDHIDIGETTLARRLLDHLRPGMLCLAAFVGFELWAAGATGADLLWRLRVNQVLPRDKVLPDGSYLSRLYPSPQHRRRGEGGVTVRVIHYCFDGVPGAEPLYRLATTLLDAAEAPAAEVAALYHERWQAETIFAEINVTLPGERLMLRSRRADLAEQEVFGLLLAHFALRCLMVQASAAVGGDPDELSFLHTVRV